MEFLFNRLLFILTKFMNTAYYILISYIIIHNKNISISMITIMLLYLYFFINFIINMKMNINKSIIFQYCHFIK